MGRTLDEIIKGLPISRRARVMRRYGELKRGLKRIISDPEIMAGEPVFAGTRIPLAHISGLIAKGVPREGIAEDYPALSRTDLAFAAIHSKMKRTTGRPRIPVRFVRRPPPQARSNARSKRP